MTKNEYMSRLRAALNQFSETTRQEVLDDYEAHFAMGMESGRTEEEICLELGPIDLFIEELSQMEPSPAVPASSDAPAASASSSAPASPAAPASSSASDTPATPASSSAPDTTTAPASSSAPDTRAASASPSAPSTPAASASPVSPDAPAAPAPASSSHRSSGHESSAAPTEYHCEKAERLILEGFHAEVSITPSSDGAFHIYYKNDGTTRQKMQYRFYFREENGTIYTGIRKSKTLSGLIVSLTSPSIFLIVQVPDHMDEIKASTISGDINLEGIRSSVLNLSSVSGDITAGHPDVQRLEISTTSGDVDASSVSAASCKLSGVSGDLRIDAKTGMCEVNNVSGDMEIITYFDTRLKLNTVNGDISLCPHAGIQGDANTVSGDVELELAETRAGLHIDFSTVSGDLDIHRRCTARQFKRGGSVDIEGEGTHNFMVNTTSGDISVR